MLPLPAIPPDSDYVFEVLEDKSLSFRRADMRKTPAREAFMTFFQMWFQAQITPEHIDQILATTPAEWRYFSVKPATGKDGKLTLQVRPAEREPGKDSGENPVITSIETTWTHH